MDEREENLINYYSLMELLEKLGKEGVAELVAKGKPRKISQGEMIYFLREDVHRIMGESMPVEPKQENESSSNDESANLIVDKWVDKIVEPRDIVAGFSFKESLLLRQKLEQEEEIYQDIPLDLSQEVLYGRTKGLSERIEAFKGHGIISSLHAKLYLDEEGNLLYQNIGVNKSKVRGCHDQSYNVLDENEIAIVVERQEFDTAILKPKPQLQVSIKLGYQVKPYFIIRIKITKKR